METPDIDKRFWFKHIGCEGKHYLIGNPHTFPGRILAWCPIKKIDFCVSKSEMAEVSEPAQYWLEGFLAGNQPYPPVDETGDVDFKSPEYENWLMEIKEFRKSGYWK